MFTGIVQEVGTVCSAARSGGNLSLTIEAKRVASELSIGSSVCVNGACLTVTRSGERFEVVVGKETLSRTTLSRLRAGATVNLETPLKPCSPLGGHFVTGHVDTTARIKKIRRQAGSEVWNIEAPQEVAKYIVEKGSIALDGISLTVASVDRRTFTVALIPHTLESTTLKNKREGDMVNLEADILAKHVEKLMGTTQEIVAR